MNGLTTILVEDNLFFIFRSLRNVYLFFILTLYTEFNT